MKERRQHNMGNIDIDINNIFFYFNRGSVHFSIHVYRPVPVCTYNLDLISLLNILF